MAKFWPGAGAPGGKTAGGTATCGKPWKNSGCEFMFSILFVHARIEHGFYETVNLAKAEKTAIFLVRGTWYTW